MPGSRFKKHRREQIRAAILIILDVARPVQTSERLVHSTLSDVDDHVAHGELRRALSYLADKDLVALDRTNPYIWKVWLTSSGVDVVQQVQKRPPGIGPIDLDLLS